MFKITTTKVLLASSTIVAAFALIVASGAIDFVADDGEVDRRIVGSLFLYWSLAAAMTLLIVNIQHRWKELVLLLSVSAVMLGIAEFTVPHIFPYLTLPKFYGISSKQYHHIYPANAEMYAGTYEGTPVVVETNEDGLRSKYSTREFLSYKDRILILGDSFTFGLGVQQSSAFPKVAERLLSARLEREDIAVLNAGIISYSPFLAKLLFRDIAELYKPTLVVFVLDATDIGDDISYSQQVRRDGDLVFFDRPNPTRTRRHYGALYELLSPYIEPYIEPYLKYPYTVLRSALRRTPSAPRRNPYGYYRFQVTIGDTLETNRFFIYRHPLEKTEKYFQRTLDNIKHIARLAGESGAPFLLVIAPRFHHWNPNECPENWEKKAYSLDEPFQYEYFKFFEQMRDRLGFGLLNLLPAFQETTEFPLVFRHDPHWNEKGHAFVGRLLTAHLVQKELIR